MTRSREIDSIFGPSTVFGRAVASVSGKIGLFRRRAPSSPVSDAHEHYAPGLESITSELPSNFNESLFANEPYKGHHIIHGVAGSGKTQMLLDRVQGLVEKTSRTASAKHKPILVLCYNEPLAQYLQHEITKRKLHRRVMVRHFMRWCREQLIAFGLEMPPRSVSANTQVKLLLKYVIDALAEGAIPSGQYAAVFVDEAHDFSRQLLPVLTQLPDTVSNHLVLFFDDTQSFFTRKRTSRIRFHHYGIQTNNVTHLTTNHRCTAPIFNAAQRLSGSLTQEEITSSDEIPRLKPVSSGRPGSAVLYFPMMNLREQGRKVAELLQHAHAEGIAWKDMVVLCRNKYQIDICDGALRYQRIPHQVRRGVGDYNPLANAVNVLSMASCQGLEFELVIVVESGEVPDTPEEVEDRERLLYIAATRAKQKLYLVGLGKSADD